MQNTWKGLESMSMSDYTMEMLHADMSAMVEEGLIEVVGINEEGDFLYGVTEHGRLVYQESISDGGGKPGGAEKEQESSS